MMINELNKRLISSIIILPISFFFIFKGSYLFIFFLTIFFFISSYEWINLNRNLYYKILGVFYLLISTYFAYLLRDNFSFKLFLFVIIICIFTDIGGYFFGKILKGPKLTKISPNKTYAGVFGSFILSTISSIIYKNLTYLDFFYFLNLQSVGINENNFDLAFISFVLFISLTSQIGDLIISYFKRLSNVKDTGKLIPGHGGLLDRTDGIIFAIPISYLILILFN